MKRFTWCARLIALGLGAFLLTSEVSADGTDSVAAFTRLKSLVGEWQGTVMTKDGPPGAVRYELTSGGSVVMSVQFPGTSHEMRTMFYLDQGVLTAVHYCSMGNQPRLRLVSMTPEELKFDLAGGSNFDAKKDMHIHAARIRLKGDALEEEWDAYQGEKKVDTKRFLLARKK